MENQVCCINVGDGTGWHSYPCQRKVKVIRDGKAYCTIHDPEYIKRKDAERWAKRDSLKCKGCGNNPFDTP